MLFEKATPKTVGYGVSDPFISFFYKWYDIVVNVKNENCFSYAACRFQKTCFEKNAFRVLRCVINMKK